MEADWNELNQVPLPSNGAHGPTSSTPSLAFDNSQELLWAGTEYGRVTSFYGVELQKYTSFRAHPASELSVKQLLVCDKGILSLSARSVHFANRRGLTQWHLTNEAFKDLRCMSFTSKGDREILLAGVQDQMFKVDVEKGTISETLDAPDKYTIMRKSGQHICAATNTGSVQVLKANTLEVLKTFKAHVGWISDMDAKADYLVTCGWSMRQPQVYVFDPMAQVFDLKLLLQLPPIPFPTGAAYVRMHPRMSTTSIIASQTGQLQVVDIMNPNSANLRQVNIYESNCYLSSLEMAPTGEALAMTDTNGVVRVWGSPTKVQYSEYGNTTEFPDIPQPNPPLDWSQDTPLSSIGMPYYRDTLLSAWPGHMLFEVGAPSPKIDPLILKNLKTTSEGTSWAPNPRTRRRNQAYEYARLVDKANGSIMAPKFLSEKARSAPDYNGDRKGGETLEALTSRLDSVTKKDVPFFYANVEIKYSKFGVEDFDFAYFNKTTFSGLETHIANSYANPLLQLYRFTPWLRNIALSHASTACLYENCLLCEMGFLVDMLEKANGANCQATNFLKTFNSLSEVPQLNLLEDLAPTTPLTTMIQDLNRFLLNKLKEDYKKVQPQMAFMDTALVTASSTNIRCMQCNKETVRADPVLSHNLIYPPKNVQRGQNRGPRPTFSQILKQSVERHISDKGYCNQCKRYRDITIRRTIQHVPAVLMLNANVLQSPEGKQLWATPNWLPQEIGIIVERGQFFCYEGEDLKLHLQRNVYPIVVYELVGVVADISSSDNQKPHLVSLINVSPSSREESAENEWHIFNDFLVHKITREEALRFDPAWKMPSIIGYQIKSARHVIDDSWKQSLDPSILYRHWSQNQETDPKKLRLLSPETEKPRAGTPVAIDAEFVELQSEEIEIRADGTRETRRPSRLGLARVSVLRGEGVDEGLPFMDDYIIMKEPVVDYLTQYSGIHPGDLDPATSSHQLVSLKVAYKKLWLLLNLGCVFVGHGLSKDFRIINIHVPRSQVVDTADLFFIKERFRKLKLSFLAWYILHEDIQTDHGHDSVEDARTALRLWRKYEEFKDAGVLEQMLRETYKKGAEIGYLPPGARREHKEKDAGKGGDAAGEDSKSLKGMQTPEKGSRAGTPSGFGMTPRQSFGGRNAFGSPLR